MYLCMCLFLFLFYYFNKLIFRYFNFLYILRFSKYFISCFLFVFLNYFPLDAFLRFLSVSPRLVLPHLILRTCSGTATRSRHHTPALLHHRILISLTVITSLLKPLIKRILWIRACPGCPLVVSSCPVRVSCSCCSRPRRCTFKRIINGE